MNVIFVTHESDEPALALITSLSKLGCRTDVLEGRQRAPKQNVAIFSQSSSNHGEELRLLMKRHIVMASHKVMGIRPEWARWTQFCHLIRNEKEFWRFDGVVAAQLKAAYESFVPLKACTRVPWGPVAQVQPQPNTLFDSLESFQEWVREAQTLA
ncbi:MAG: hypothetical protein UX26_C0009G0004 [Parcubacteria group bacterium GW2011_GWC1_45_9]|nr:MAG: hypothetical protein UW85_C0010G0008 [Parcubacteria group bacterium GW2011_GWA1_Parcubacteria_45_10]KKT88599.1 MAG: hypothetical protein UW89_C0006G0007 [Parcubacteria group bacterium GW2011_GWB1_45_10]KKU17039.1 MAG: hypothetical protein UX26_C0009G0004 [Parcubacteria group bacterium GW2011_GWC1_45_9]HCI05223.1 hypothetical protein [Patescibacteria group bacterium]